MVVAEDQTNNVSCFGVSHLMNARPPDKRSVVIVELNSVAAKKAANTR